MAFKKKHSIAYKHYLSDEEAISDQGIQIAVNGYQIAEEIGIYPYLRMIRRTPNDVMDSNGCVDESKTGIGDISLPSCINFNTEGLTTDKGFVCYNDARDKGRPPLEALMSRWNWGKGSYGKLKCESYLPDFDGYVIGYRSDDYSPIEQKSKLNINQPDRTNDANPTFYIYRIEDVLFTTASSIPMASFEKLLLENNEMSFPCSGVLFDMMTHLMLSLESFGYYLENGQVSRFSYAITANKEELLKGTTNLDSFMTEFDIPGSYFPFYNTQSSSETFKVRLVNIPTVNLIDDRIPSYVKSVLINLVRQQLIPLGRLYYLNDSEKLILVPVSKEEHFAYAIADYGNIVNALDSSLKMDTFAIMPKEVFKEMALGISESLIMHYNQAKKKISNISIEDLKNISKDDLYVEILSQILKFIELIVKQVESLDCSVAETLVSNIICKESTIKESSYICPSRIVTNKAFKL